GAGGGKRQARWQCAGSDREVVGRGAAAGGQGLGIQRAADSGGQRRRRQRDAGGIDHERVMLVYSEAEIVGSGDGEVEAACGGRRARQRAVAGEGQAGRQRAQADGEGVRRGAEGGLDHLVVGSTGGGGRQRRLDEGDRRRMNLHGEAVLGGVRRSEAGTAVRDED